MSHLSLYVTLALIAGLVAGVSLDLGSLTPYSVALAVSFAGTTFAFMRGRPREQLAGGLAAAAAAGVLLGAHGLQGALHPPLRNLLEQRLGGFAIDSADVARAEEPIVIEGRLQTDAALTPTGVLLRVRVERVWLGPCPEPVSGGVSIGVSGAMQADHLREWTAGRLIRAPALLRRPARYLNEGVPDMERAMGRRGVALVGTIKSATLVEVRERAWWWEEAAAAVRARTRDAMARHVAPRDTASAAIGTAILIGDRAAIDYEVERRLQEAGTYHVIAISGGNIAVLAALVLGALSLLGVRGAAAALGAIGVLAAYALIAAGGASVARATLMGVLYLALRLIDQRTAAANAIALTAAILLLIRPVAITDVGLWLTFGATAAIVAGVSRIGKAGPSAARAALTLLVASVSAEIVLAPVTAAIFQRVSVAGLLLNFIAIPCMTVVQMAAMATVLLDAGRLEPLAAAAGMLVHWAARGLVDSTALLDVAPWLTWRVPSPHVIVIATYYFALVLAWRLPHRNLRRAFAACAAIFFLWMVAAPAARMRALGDGRLYLSVIDVGQGDALLVTFPNGRKLVVDAGGVTLRGEFDVGERVIAPALRARRVLEVDYLAVTHGDPDHVGGARTLVRDFRPREIWWGPTVANHEPEAVLRAEAVRARAAWRTLQRGDRLEIGGVQVRVHHPPPPEWERQKVRNDDSLVLELRYGTVSTLLTGDIGRAVEEELLPGLDLLPLVVLKVPHHGSGTSSSEPFLMRLAPRIALIGVGRGNRYGHPMPYVLERYHRAGTQVFRTDQDGQIDVAIDGQQVVVDTWTGRRVLR